MRRSALAFAAWTVLAASGCAHSRMPSLPADAPLDAHGREVAEDLRGTVHALVDGGWNPGRLQAAERRARQFGLGQRTHTEWIDWFSFQHNVVIDLPGASEQLVLIVAHADKTDVNLLKVWSLLLNGLFDELVGWSYLSEGALDNASGVALALQLAKALGHQPLKRSYRILITGAEESGLRGARAHAARMSRLEWTRLAFVLNLDSLGAVDDDTCVYTDVSDVSLTRRAQDAALARGLRFRRGEMPFFGTGDHAPFAATSFFHDLGRGLLFSTAGGVLPQRSWFTGVHGAKVLVVADCHLTDLGDDLSAVLPVFGFGRLHGPRDRAERLDPVRMTQAYQVLWDVLGEDGGAWLTPAPAPGETPSPP